MSIPLRPQHFVSRLNGNLTALVAVDELPDFISIRGIPRVLNLSDITGMTSLGSLPARGQTYTVDVDFSQGKAPEPAPSHQRRSWRNTEPVEPAGREVVKHAGHGQEEVNSPKSSGEKKFCTHFIRKNQCDYKGQGKGCKYQHEFVEGQPETLEMLKLYGLNEIPPWCRVKENDKSTTPSAGNSLPGRLWRSESREHSVPQGAHVEWTAPRSVTSAGPETAGRYASSSSSPGRHRHHQPAVRPGAQSAKDPHVHAERTQLFRSLAVIDQDNVFSGAIPLQPTNRTERAVNHEVGVDGKSHNTSTWANQENVDPSISSYFKSAAAHTAASQAQQNANPNRGYRLYEPRTTNEVPSATGHGHSLPQTRSMHENNRRSDSAPGRHSAPIPLSASPPPFGSRPPSRMTEVNSSYYYSSPFLSSSGLPRPSPFSYGQAMAAPARRPHLALEADHYVREKKVKQNNDHPHNHNMSMLVNMSEPSSANGLASRIATPDSIESFGLIKFD